MSDDGDLLLAFWRVAQARRLRDARRADVTRMAHRSRSRRMSAIGQWNAATRRWAKATLALNRALERAQRPSLPPR